MKLNRLIATCGLAAALCLSAGSLFAQDNTNDNGNGGQGGQGRRQRGQGGPSGGNFDPAQMQQRMMERVKEDLGYTNDTEWSAVEPLVQKVMDARRDVGFGGMGRMFRNRGGNNNGGPGGGRGFGPEPSAEQKALQDAIDNNAPKAQIKAALDKYRASQKDKQAKLEQAQANLKKVLTQKQEAQAVLSGLVN